jgi:thiol-disulfide isomerase/thioredoxin
MDTMSLYRLEPPNILSTPKVDMQELKPMWLFISGLVLLLVFVMLVTHSRGRHPWHPWHPMHYWLSGTGKPWILPGQAHLYGEGFTADATFYMFGVDWCPHCVSAKPEFEALGSTKTIGGKNVHCVYVNPEKEPEKAQGFEIDGYPTLVLQKADGSLKKYGGPRTQAGFLEFLQNAV